MKAFIKHDNLPPTLHINFIVVWSLLLDRIKAPQWAWAAMVTFYVLLLIGEAKRFFTYKMIDIGEVK